MIIIALIGGNDSG